MRPIIGIIFVIGLLSEASGEEIFRQSQVKLVAEPRSRLDPVSQIQKVFGKASVQAPDQFENNHPEQDHIHIGEDPAVGGFFRFTLHRDHDGDRNKARDETDRQRNEIMGYAGSNEGLKATLGQVARYQWVFRVDQEMKVTPQFCHFFQLKGVGGTDAGNPFFTLTGAKSNGRSRIELRYWKGDQHPFEKFHIAHWNDIAGEWLQADCLVDYKENGSFRMSISRLNGERIFDIELNELKTWRTGIEFVRPKWGIYRSLAKAYLIPNEQDHTSFANFLVEEWSGEAAKIWTRIIQPGEAAKTIPLESNR